MDKNKGCKDKFPAEERPHKKGKSDKDVIGNTGKVTVSNESSEKAVGEEKH